ncbi:MAG: hypothetical protein R2744_00050 [Bacteroidales bacterium]
MNRVSAVRRGETMAATDSVPRKINSDNQMANLSVENDFHKLRIIETTTSVYIKTVNTFENPSPNCSVKGIAKHSAMVGEAYLKEPTEGMLDSPGTEPRNMKPWKHQQGNNQEGKKVTAPFSVPGQEKMEKNDRFANCAIIAVIVRYTASVKITSKTRSRVVPLLMNRME